MTLSKTGPKEFLVDSEYFEIGSPSVRRVVEERCSALQTPEEKAVGLFAYVRDRVDYEFTVPLDPGKYRAGRTLEDGVGFCVRKAIVLCALGRAAGIPSALVYCDLRDHSLPKTVVRAMGTDCMHHHGLAAFFLGGQWLKMDPSLPAHYAEKRKLHLVQFDGSSDTLQLPVDMAGKPHVDYTVWHGMERDFSFPSLMGALAEGFSGADSAQLRAMGLSTPEDFARSAQQFAG